MFKQFFNFGTANMEEQLADFKLRMNNIVNDLMSPNRSPEDNFRDILSLLDSNKCNAHAIFLSKELDTKYTSYDLAQFKDKIKISRDTFKECNQGVCSEVDKKELLYKDGKILKPPTPK